MSEKSILITDDDEFLRDMYALKFKEAGFEVTLCQNGEEAVAALKGGARPAVVTMDMIMPGMSGKELLAELKGGKIDPAYKPLCVVLSNEERDESEIKELGADGYIVKAQMVPSEVVSAVEKIVEKGGS